MRDVIRTCLHWDGSELLWISATRADTNGLNSLAWLRIHDNTMLLSEKNTTFSNCSLDSSAMDWYSLVASTAACSSRRGMVSGFSGATLDLAAMNRVILIALGSPSDVGTSTKALLDASEKIQSIGSAIASTGVRDLSKVAWFKSPISWKKQIHSSRVAEGSSWSHSKACGHRCCFQFSRELGRLLRIQLDQIFEQSGWALFSQVNVGKQHIFGMIPNSS